MSAMWKLDCREIKVGSRGTFRWCDNIFCYGGGWIVALLDKWEITLIIISIKNLWNTYSMPDNTLSTLYSRS